jgi:PTH1 family peptidyl-tRNA hydrolase
MRVSAYNAQAIKIMIGLGNPGLTYYKTRHSIGFRVLDALANRVAIDWIKKDNQEQAEWVVNDRSIVLIKPLTYMNSSGTVLPALQRHGIKAEHILVVHDELELPLGKLAFKRGGSHRGHNGLKSLISWVGPDFLRFRFGIGRPELKEDVPDYVLASFNPEEAPKVNGLLEQSVDVIANLF